MMMRYTSTGMLCVSVFCFLCPLIEEKIITQEYVVRKRPSVHALTFKNDMLFCICQFFKYLTGLLLPEGLVG